ncbi:MAG TPA: inositol monophosphatase family protein [Polyangiaceae bacterium]
MTTSELDIVIDAARAGAAILRDRFANFATLAVAVKGPSDFVSAADFASEAAIKKSIAAAMPGARFQAEETTEARATSGERFIIDPLDGTTNFLHGIPHFAVSIAFWDDAGARAGVVVDPMRDEIFCATRGGGAHLVTPSGKRRLTGSKHASLSDSVVHTGVPHRGRQDHALYLRQLPRVMEQVVGIRRLGAAALDLAYVAAGRGEAFFEKGLQPWDMAAGLLLVREAGGIVTDYSGADDMMRNSEVVVGMPKVHAELLRVLSSGHESSVA